MTITVLGHLCIDEIHTPRNVENESSSTKDFGGIYFSLVTLASMMKPGDVIYPVFGVGDMEYDEFKKKLEAYPAIDASGIFKFKGNSNHVHYFPEKDRNGRFECSKNISDPIPFNKIKPFLDTHGILVNMVSGFDITLETMDAIRMNVRDARTPIHFDFHSLTLGIDQDFKRFRRPMTDWRRWCFMLNSIQMTEEEAAGLTAEHYDEPTLVNQLMPLMVNTLVITRGERGATAIIQENKKLTHHEIAGTSFGPTIDPLGCGDVFGAAFFCRYLQQKNYRDAAEYANQFAGMKCTLNGTADIPTIVEKLKSVPVTHEP